MIIHGGIEDWSDDMINDVFFKDQNVWIKLNQLILSMQRYVMKNKDYAELVENKIF